MFVRSIRFVPVVVLGLGIVGVVGLHMCCLLPAARVRGRCCCYVVCLTSSALNSACISHSHVVFMLHILVSHSRLSYVHFSALALCRACELTSLRFALAPRLHCAFARAPRMSFACALGTVCLTAT